jgi:hypothetical protein
LVAVKDGARLSKTQARCSLAPWIQRVKVLLVDVDRFRRKAHAFVQGAMVSTDVMIEQR